MSQILNRVRDVDSNNSDAIKEALGAFFQNLLKHKDSDCISWLRALKDVINRFPKYCGSHRPTIESFLAHFLNSNNFCNVIEAAKCSHALQQVRPLQEKTATAKSCWRDQMKALCDAAHKLIDALFVKSNTYSRQINQKVQETTSSSSFHETLLEIDSLAGNQDKVLDKNTTLCTRLRNILVFIQAMLVEIYPVAKPVQPQLVLQVILQALSAPGSEDSSTVTAVKTQALRTLDAIVACLGSNLIPFSALIFRFVMQTLKWSSDNTSEESSKVRIQAYRSLSTWLDTLHVHRPHGARAWLGDLVAHVCADVAPVRRTVQLTVNASMPMKNLSKKARKRLANNMLRESNIAAHMPGDKDRNNLSDKSNDEVAIAALECAETLLSVCGIFLNEVIHKQLQELLVRECFAISTYSTERAMSLLHGLEASRKNCSPRAPPPTQYCLQLYSEHINNTQREISKFCSAALLDIRLHLHCSPPSLNFSLEETPVIKEKHTDKKRISEKNREALEKLLGNDWNSSSSVATTILLDEPDNKRRRTSETVDNVSISSESIHSIDSEDSMIYIDPAVDIQPETNDKDRDALQLVEAEVHNQIAQQENTAEVNDSDPISSVEKLSQNVHDKPTQMNNSIHSAITQIPTINIEGEDENDEDIAILDEEKILKTPESDINEAKTQLLPNSDTIDGKSPVSMEVAYDFPNTGKDKVKVLDKIDDENLPSSNDTDDIQITCGQVVKSSQDLDTEKKESEIENNNENKVQLLNGITNGETVNGDAFNNEEAVSKTMPCEKTVTVEDMLADFVDEVNEDNPV